MRLRKFQPSPSSSSATHSVSGDTFRAGGTRAPACRVFLRQAQEADLSAMNHLMQTSRAYKGEWRRILDGYVITADQIARDDVVLAEYDGEVLGFYSLITNGESELDLMFVADSASPR